MKNTKAARVIFPTGEVKQLKELLNAAELMLEHPNYFLANSRFLHIGRRFHALGADEELEFGNVYIFFPMRRVNSFVTAADVALFFMAANSATKRIISSGGRVRRQMEESFQESNNNRVVARLSLERVGSVGFHNRLSYCRTRKPMLETISEEPIRSK
ncbi:hypothetical protein TanjilG_30312 [Lupinus angustifolius]|nr:hypothetical protein TanjilG_30312 [Lupinus angustifolius]